MKEDYELITGKPPPSELTESDRKIGVVDITTVTASDEHKSDHRCHPLSERANLSNGTHSEEIAEQRSSHKLSNKSSSSSEAGKEYDKVIKELKKVQRQNFLTHCLVSALIVLTLTWQLSEVSLILKVKEGLNHPFRSLGGFITGMFIGANKPIVNITEDEKPANGKQKQGVEASSLPVKIPDLPHLDLPSLDFITEEE